MFIMLFLFYAFENFYNIHLKILITYNVPNYIILSSQTSVYVKEEGSF